MKWLFVGPVKLSGIGQVMSKYSELLDGDYATFTDDVTRAEYDRVFAFIIPQKNSFRYIVDKFKPDMVMTVCETEPVHENYKLIFDEFKTVLVPSEFCKDIFLKQFPGSDIRVFPHWPGPVTAAVTAQNDDDRPYTFYTIGNVVDPRKNTKMLIEAFIRCEFGPKARLLIKATCIEPVKWKIPNVTVINGLLSDEDMGKIHEMCDCYVNCSHSEGVGMGAVEAAMRNKPVIVTDYGGLKEYVHSPFVVTTTPSKVGMYDFLFEPDMMWGQPNMDDLIRHMKHCFENNVREWNHEHTREFTSGSVLRTKLADLSLALTGSSVEVLSLTNENDCGDWCLV